MCVFPHSYINSVTMSRTFYLLHLWTIYVFWHSPFFEPLLYLSASLLLPLIQHFHFSGTWRTVCGFCFEKCSKNKDDYHAGDDTGNFRVRRGWPNRVLLCTADGYLKNPCTGITGSPCDDDKDPVLLWKQHINQGHTWLASIRRRVFVCLYLCARVFSSPPHLPHHNIISSQQKKNRPRPIMFFWEAEKMNRCPLEVQHCFWCSTIQFLFARAPPVSPWFGWSLMEDSRCLK